MIIVFFSFHYPRSKCSFTNDNNAPNCRRKAAVASIASSDPAKQTKLERKIGKKIFRLARRSVHLTMTMTVDKISTVWTKILHTI